MILGGHPRYARRKRARRKKLWTQLLYHNVQLYYWFFVEKTSVKQESNLKWVRIFRWNVWLKFTPLLTKSRAPSSLLPVTFKFTATTQVTFKFTATTRVTFKFTGRITFKFTTRVTFKFSARPESPSSLLPESPLSLPPWWVTSSGQTHKWFHIWGEVFMHSCSDI